MNECGFNTAYVGACRSKKITEDGKCASHQDKCAMCGKPAIETCCFAGQFVCGMPVCGTCNHYETHGTFRI